MGTKKSNKLYAAAAALAVTASAVAPGLTADAASKVTVKSVTNPASISHYGGYTFAVKKLSLPKTVKVLLSNKKYENRSVKWGKVSYDKKYIGKYQTISGTVSGTTKKASIKVKLNNYPVDVVEPKLAPVAVGEKLNLPSTIDVKYKDGKVIARSAKSFNLTAEKTDKAGMMKLSYNYMGKNSSIKGSIAYEVKAAEITNVMDSVKEDVLSVSADVKFPAKDAKAQLLIFPGKDESKALPAIEGKLENGKFTAEGKMIPEGTHSYAVKVGEVVTPAKEFKINIEAAVKEVKALNASELVVKFSKSVDKDSAETLVNYSVDNNTVTGASLNEDGKSVTLTLGSAVTTKTTTAVKVSNVKLKDSQDKFPLFAGVVTIEDTEGAQIAKVEAVTAGTSATSATITFSEAVLAGTPIKVNGVVVGATASGKTTTLTGLSLDATAQHAVEIVNLTDGANNKSTVNKSFAVTKDVAAPMVAAVEPYGDNKIKLIFDKSVRLADVQSKVSVKDELLSNVAIGTIATASAGATTMDKEFIVPVSSALYSQVKSRTLTVVVAAGINDSLGNSSAAVTKAVTLTKDEVAPVVLSAEKVNNASGATTGIKFKFSEGVAAMGSGLDESKVKVIDKNGVDVTSGFFKATQSAVVTGDKEATLDLTTATSLDGVYTFMISSAFVSDSAQTPNTSVAVTKTVDFGAPTQSEFSITAANVTSTNTKANDITIDFGQVVKGGAVTGSATDAARYTLGGKPLPAGTLITLNPARDEVTIDLPDTDSIAKSDTAATFTVDGVQNLSGVINKPFVKTLSIVDNTAPVLNSAVLNSNGSVTLGFDEALATAAVKGDFVVTANGLTIDAAQLDLTAGVGAEAGKFVLTADALLSNNGTAGDATDDFYYIDANNDGAYVSGQDIKVSSVLTVGASSYVAKLNSTEITSLKVKTGSGVLTGADLESNKIATNKEIVVR